MSETRAGIDRPEYLRLVALGPLIGIPAALIAAGLLGLVHELEHVLWDDLPGALGHSSPPVYLVIVLPVAGPPSWPAAAAGVALAALGTLSFGAVLGPEAPLIALGGIVGVAVAPLLRAGPAETGVLGMAGSFSAISSLFGGPIVAGMLLVEASAARLGAALIPTLLPGLVAAACGYLLFVGLGDWGGLDSAPLTVPGLPEYAGRGSPTSCSAPASGSRPRLCWWG